MSDPDINPIARSMQKNPAPRPRGGNARRKPPFYKRWWFATFFILLLLSSVAALAVALTFLKPLQEQAEQFDMSALQKIERASLIFDRRGEDIGRIYVLNRTPIKVEQVPMHFIQALTAEEDSRFFQHGGVDFTGVLRAVWLNYKGGSENQGASTITQQLARDAFKLKELETGDKKSRYNRKIVEWFAASRIERHLTKSEILELYLNRIYFGGGFYGVQSAAQGYFGKDAQDLTIEESATLCGLIKSPNNLQPLRHPDRAKKARNHVYDRMEVEGYLSKEEMAVLSEKPVITSPRIADARLSHVYEEIRQQAVSIIGDEEAQLGGFNIYTTIDGKLQKAAEKAMSDRLEALEKAKGYPHQTFQQYRVLVDDYRRKVIGKTLPADTPKPKPSYIQGAILALDNRDGSVLAMVGGRDYLDSMFNRAVQSKRPAGTAFLPFVYATAFGKPEYYPPVSLEDGPIDNRRVMIGGLTGILGEWGTEQDVTRYESSITAREALSQSRNAATVRLGEKLTLPPVKALAARAGIKSVIRDFPSSFLGASEVKLDEMCLAYSAFANKGKRPKQLSLIHRITDHDGKVIYQIKEEEDAMVPVMDEIAAYQTHTCLVDALKRGTGRPAFEEYGLKNLPFAGKTGTHYEFKDLWFFGYSSAVTCGVWGGFDQQKTIYTGAYSNRVVLPIWTDVMNATVKDYPPEEIQPPVGGRLIEVCQKSGKRATDACYDKVPDPVNGGFKAVRNTYKELLREGSNYDEYCEVHRGSDAASFLARLRATDTMSPSQSPVNPLLSNVIPVRMKGVTVLGNDPYNTVQPIIRAEPVNDDGTVIQRAEPVEEQSEQMTPIKLSPPPPLKLE
ncbi:PBP1A family penicillin-binding protein [soil metagenome]